MTEGKTSPQHDQKLPYPASWLDQLLEWIDRLPGPIWIYYLLALLFFFLLISGVFWIDGALPFGEISPTISSFSIYVVYWIALYHYLSGVGSRALSSFRPLLDVDDTEITRLEHELTKLPRWLGWLSIPLAVVFTVFLIMGEPEPYGDLIPKTILPTIFDVILTSFMVSAFFILLIRSIRQLRMVNLLHKRASRLNILDLDPAHAFSNLTARTGAGVIILILLAYIQDPTSYSRGIDIFSTLITLLVAVGIFIIPLMGLQARLNDEKKRKLAENSDLLSIASQRLHTKIRTDDYVEMGETKDAIAALIQEHELLRKISIWPWDPATFRGFGSTLLVPIVLWVVTRLLERFL